MKLKLQSKFGEDIMYELLIVDDKRTVTDGIANHVNWDKYGLTVSCAYNGKEAYDIIRKSKVDIVVTDIRMPLMDGLELTKLTKEYNNKIKVIILSGYDDFQYAQKAIKIGADEYLLKPTRIDTIKESVLNFKNQIVMEEEKNEDVILMRQRLRQSIPLLKDKFFRNIINGKELNNDNKLEQHFNFIDMNLELKNFVVMIIEVDDYENLRVNNKSEILELYRFSICNISQEILATGFNNEVFRHLENEVVVLLNFDGNQSKMINHYQVYKIANEIKESINKFFEFTVTISIGEFYKNIDGIYYSYRDAKNALAHKIYLGKDRVIPIQDLQLNNQDFSYPINIEEKTLVAVRSGEPDKIREHLDDMFNKIKNQNHVPPYLLKSNFTRFIIEIYKLNNNNSMHNKLVDNLFNFNKLKTLDEIRQWFETKLIDVAVLIQREKRSQIEIAMEKAKEYIDRHYDERITLNVISEYICMSPTYFSAMFKEITNINFSEYLKVVRIDKAKELLRLNKYRIYEICNLVGYNDTKYFTDIFKKHTGMTPTVYVKQLDQ